MHVNRRITRSGRSGVLGIDGDDIGGESLGICVVTFSICPLTVKKKSLPMVRYS